jgi:hypothetical protein
MAGVFGSVGELFTGESGMGTEGSNINPIATQDYINNSLWSQDFARQQAQLAAQRQGWQWTTQQGLMPLVYDQMARQEGYNQGLQSQSSAAERLARTAEQTVPWQYQNMGYTPGQDAQGNFTLSEDPRSNRAASQALQGQFLNRSAAAMRGELPVDPHLQRQLDESERQLRDSLIKNFGPGYDTTTPGIQALAEFNQRKNESIFSAQHNEIGSAAQLASMMGQGNLAQQQANAQNFYGIPLNAQQAALQAQGAIQNTRTSPLQSLGALYGGINAAFQDPGAMNLAQLYANASAQQGNLGLGTGAQIMQGKLANWQTDPDNKNKGFLGLGIGGEGGGFFGGALGGGPSGNGFVGSMAGSFLGGAGGAMGKAALA